VVLKEMAPKLLVQCIRKVHGGGEWFETRSVSRILGEIRQRNTKTHRGGELTAREREIVSTVGWGLRNHEIAEGCLSA
jgi:two-component system, NarL family, nitrate/nitrite response regulator NarL